MDNSDYDRIYYREHKEEIRKNNKQWANDNPEKVRELAKQWRNNNVEKRKIEALLWSKNNPEKVEIIKKRYYKKNFSKIIQHNNQYTRKKRKTNPKFNLNSKIVGAIGCSLRGNKAGRHWETIVGYTLNDLIKRLKKTIPKGYKWEDILNGELHIDHKIPIKVFNFTKPEHQDFKRCWALSNLRLLPAKENLKKGGKLTKPFQPALKI